MHQVKIYDKHGKIKKIISTKKVTKDFWKNINNEAYSSIALRKRNKAQALARMAQAKYKERGNE
jgi:hypothetical protein